MKATEAKLLGFLKQSPQFVIPIYQRTYSWMESECKQLWEDIIRAGGNEDILAHFIGSIVYIEKGLYHVSSQSPLLVIDGQQRLTTVSLILEALARNMEDGQEPVEGFSAKKIRNYYLLNPLEDDEDSYKLLLAKTDKETLKAIMTQRYLPDEHSLRLEKNFEMFMGWVGALGSDLEPLCKGLAKLMVVDISLSRDQDNPQLIFESMNSTGKELSQADLIRNYVLMDLEPKHQQKLYNDHWRPMEQAFGQEAYGKHFDGFMRHYLTLKTDNIPRIKEVYDAFKEYAGDPKVAKNGVDAVVADLHQYAGYYCALALGEEWQSVQEKWLHTLGNLTLTGYNSEYSDKPFCEKRDMPGGFKESPLRLNRGLGDLETWDADTIQERAERLARKAVEVWKAPGLSPGILDAYRPKQENRKSEYTIEDHPNLSRDSDMRPLFDMFRRRVLAIDPCVTEDFLKLYVAYKAETNFVDVVPQAKKLRLSLNMKFHELNDPRGIARDVSDLGRWGNGDVEVEFSRPEQLAHVMSLVRQAYERQMGNGNGQSLD